MLKLPWAARPSLAVSAFRERVLENAAASSWLSFAAASNRLSFTFQQKDTADPANDEPRL
jgi:hypothetical protein